MELRFYQERKLTPPFLQKSGEILNPKTDMHFYKYLYESFENIIKNDQNSTIVESDEVYYTFQQRYTKEGLKKKLTKSNVTPVSKLDIYESFRNEMSRPDRRKELLQVIAYHFPTCTYYVKLLLNDKYIIERKKEEDVKKMCYRGLDKFLLYIKDVFTVHSVKFDPSIIGGTDFVNTFMGINAEVVERGRYGRLIHKDIELFEDFCNFISEVWADNNKENAEYIINWIAWRFQNMNKKPLTAIFLISPEGCGKNIMTNFLTNYIIGERHSISNLSDAKRLTGNFNSIIEDKLLIIANEFTSEMKNYVINTNILKSHITEEKQIIEGKYQNARVIDDYSGFIFLTNNYNPIKIDENSRRYAIFEASTKYKGNTEFFNNFIKKFYNQEAANIVYTALLKRDLTNFDITQFPRTELLYKIIDSSKDSCQAFVEDRIEEIRERCDENKQISLLELYKLYSIYCEVESESKKYGKIKFNKKLQDLKYFRCKKTKDGMIMELLL